MGTKTFGWCSDHRQHFGVGGKCSDCEDEAALIADAEARGEARGREAILRELIAQLAHDRGFRLSSDSDYITGMRDALGAVIRRLETAQRRAQAAASPAPRGED